MLSSPSDDDDYYPGSRTKRREKLEPNRTKHPAEWQTRPTIKIVKGKPREFFPITALCEALDKRAVTVRLWIRKGYLPTSTFRLPPTTVNGRVIKGRRLYTRTQIEAVIRIASEHGILYADRVRWSDHKDFALHVAAAWEEIRLEEKSRGL